MSVERVTNHVDMGMIDVRHLLDAVVRVQCDWVSLRLNRASRTVVISPCGGCGLASGVAVGPSWACLLPDRLRINNPGSRWAEWPPSMFGGAATLALSGDALAIRSHDPAAATVFRLEVKS